MKRLFGIIKSVVLRVNMFIISLLLSVVYVLIITPYSLLFKSNRERWIVRDKIFTYEDLKNMW